MTSRDAEWRLEAPEKLTGAARYAVEIPVEGAVYGWPVHATVAAGRVVSVDAAEALGVDGVLTVLSHANAPRLGELADEEARPLQTDQVSYRGQVVALVVAEREEVARDAAGRVRVTYEQREHDVVLTDCHPDLYAPEKVNAGYPADTEEGAVGVALSGSAATIDATYSTPPLHNHPMEPHASTAQWDDDLLTVWDSTQGTTSVAADLATLFGVDPRNVRVRAEHVGGGFGSKGTVRPNAVLAAMAARAVGRPVHLAFSRRAMFFLVGHRTPTIQRVQLGADAGGRLLAVAHDVYEQTSRIQEFAEQTAVATRSMYAAPARRTRHRLVRLDVPTPRWMRAPGECPGMFALESAMDELAHALGIDPVELRLRNEPEREPGTGLEFSSRNLAACLREGSERFGWAGRHERRREGSWLIGYGVAASTYPAYVRAAGAVARAEPDGRFVVGVNATDIGTGARTVLRTLAAEVLGVDPARVEIRIADSDLPPAPVAGGSAGTASWGWAVTNACERLRGHLHDGVPPEGLEVGANTEQDVADRPKRARGAYGAQFAEVGVDADTGEVRLRRLVGVFAAGRILNPRTARSQLLGGMTMGVSMALLEEGRIDPRVGQQMNTDLAGYHLATAADVPGLEAYWIEEHDDSLNPMGSKGIGEIGIVGTAAAVTNAVHDATGIRVRDLPVRIDRILAQLT